VVESKPICQPDIPISRLKLTARITAWILLFTIIISVLSGWGITRTEIIFNLSGGLVDRGMANSIHRLLQTPMAVVFLIHVLINLRLTIFPQYLHSDRIANALIAIAGVVIMAMVLFMEYLA
jgi:hypothetical protein